MASFTRLSALATTAVILALAQQPATWRYGMEFRDGKVVHERIYFGEPWEPPAWRAQWVEPMKEPEASEASA